jgi:hypothetical protein
MRWGNHWESIGNADMAKQIESAKAYANEYTSLHTLLYNFYINTQSPRFVIIDQI